MECVIILTVRIRTGGHGIEHFQNRCSVKSRLEGHFRKWHMNWKQTFATILSILHTINTQEMKYAFILLLSVCLITEASLAQDSHTPYLTKSLSKEKVSSVYARTSGGNIQVSGVSAGEARIEVYVNSNNNSMSKDEISRRLKEDYELKVEVSDNKLTATAEAERSFSDWKHSLNISFKIYVPAQVSTDLRTSGGGIELTNLSGTQEFTTSGGGLSLSKVSGKVRGKTSGGGISLKECKDDIVLNTSGGGIQAENCSGTLRLTTSGGSIELTTLDGEIEAETSGGPIRGEHIRGKLGAHTSGGQIKLRDLACVIDASTSGGSIDAEIAEVVGSVTFNNSGGNIKLTMPSNRGLDLRLRGESISTVKLQNFSGDQDDNSIHGKINGGGIPVSVSTSGRLTFALN